MPDGAPASSMGVPVLGGAVRLNIEGFVNTGSPERPLGEQLSVDNFPDQGDMRGGLLD